MMLSSKAKRKVDNEHRLFLEKWGTDYLTARLLSVEKQCMAVPQSGMYISNHPTQCSMPEAALINKNKRHAVNDKKKKQTGCTSMEEEGI